MRMQFGTYPVQPCAGPVIGHYMASLQGIAEKVMLSITGHEALLVIDRRDIAS